MSTIGLRAEQRARWISRAVLALAGALVALSCAQAAYRLWLPTEGWDYTSSEDFEENTLGFTRNLLGEPTPLRKGDQLVAAGRAHCRTAARD